MDSKIAIKQLNFLKKSGNKMRLAADEWPTKFQTLISIILSARTRDETTIKVCTNLFSKYPTAKKLSTLSLDEVKKPIYSVNFYNNKAKSILACSKELAKRKKFPETFDELVKLPGVGRKTANVFLAEYGNDEIGVDTHVTYISNYLGWANSRKQEIIEKQLKKLFPKKYYKEINWILVQFGKTHTSKKQKNEILDEIKKID